jgi:hypothetical protein
VKELIRRGYTISEGVGEEILKKIIEIEKETRE